VGTSVEHLRSTGRSDTGNKIGEPEVGKGGGGELREKRGAGKSDIPQLNL